LEAVSMNIWLLEVAHDAAALPSSV